MSTTRHERAEALRVAVQELVDRSSLAEAAEVIGVSVGAIRNLISGSVPQRATMAVFEQWAGEAGVRIPIRPSRVREEVVRDLAPEDQRWLTARVAGLGYPGQNGARKLRVISRYEELLRDAGEDTPAWWYDLRGRVEAGEI